MAFTPNAPQPNSYECQHCGAKLPPPTAEGTQTCLYCQAVYTVQREASNPQGGFTIVFGSGTSTFGSSPASFGSYPAPSSQAIDAMMNAGVKTAKWSLFIGLFITVVVIAAVCVPLYFAFKDGFDFTSGVTNKVTLPGGGDLDFTFAEDGALILPGEPTAPTQIVQIASYYDREASASKSAMLKIDTGTKAVVWRSKPFEETSFGRAVRTDGVNAYVPDKAKIRAIKLSDGTDVWSGPLSDKVSTSCADCVELMGTKLIVRTDDGQVQAIDTTTGASSWNRKVSDVRARPYPAGDKLLILDGDKGTYNLSIVNPVDGADLGTITPDCGRSSGIRPDSQVVPSPLENAVYLGMGTSSPCWQKFDLANPAAPVFTAPVDGGYLDTDDAFPTFAEGHIVWSQRGAGGAIGDLDVTTGTASLIIEDDDVSFAVAGLAGGRIVARATTTQGTQKMSIRAYDLASRAQLWEKALGEAGSMDGGDEAASNILSDDKSLVTMRITPEGQVLLATVSATKTDTTVKAETIDGATGVTAGAPTAVSLGKPIGSIDANLIGWVGPRVSLLAADRIATLDASTGALVSTVP